MQGQRTIENAPLGDGARDVAFRRLGVQARRFPNLLLEPLETTGLTPLDAAFANAIHDATVRRWRTLEHIICNAAEINWSTTEVGLRGLLLGAAAQMIFLDRVPHHAAVNHAVTWARERLSARVGGLVNAVLRRVSAAVGPDRRSEPWCSERDRIPTADGRGSLMLAPSVHLPEIESARLAVAVSCTEHLARRWIQRFGRSEGMRLLMHTLHAPPIVVNVESATQGDPILADPNLTAHARRDSRIFAGTRADLESLLSGRANIWIQDAASAASIDSIADLQPTTILDLCAGRGTKTRQLVAKFPGARIFAADQDQERARTLASVFQGHEQVRVVPFSRIRQECLGAMDLIVLDVPCSNSGVLARRPEAKYRFDDAHLESITGVQRQIIADAIPLLSPAGRRAGVGGILYATCSLEREENDDQSAWIAKWHSYRAARQHGRMPVAEPGAYADGSFSVLWQAPAHAL